MARANTAGDQAPAREPREPYKSPRQMDISGREKPKNLPPAMPHDQKAIEQTKRDCWDDEQIHRRDAVGMIVETCFPAFGRRPSTPGHILGHARLTDIDAELEKFAVDTWRSPKWICDTHFPDELACFQWYRRPATMASRVPAPVQPETRAMPANNGVRLHDCQHLANLWK